MKYFAAVGIALTISYAVGLLLAITTYYMPVNEEWVFRALFVFMTFLYAHELVERKWK